MNSRLKGYVNNYFTINSFASMHTTPQQIISVSFQPKFNPMKYQRLLESFMYINLSCVSKESLTSFFLVCTPFNSIFALLFQLRLQIFYAGKEETNLSSFWFSGNSLKLYLFRMVFDVGFPYVIFIILNCIPGIPILLSMFFRSGK